MAKGPYLVKRHHQAFLIPLPYYAIDAALYAWLTDILPLRVNDTIVEGKQIIRQELTTGSVRYHLTANGAILSFVVRAFDAQLTLLYSEQEDPTWVDTLLQEFFSWHNHERSLATAEQERVATQATTKRGKPGRDLEPINKWAVNQFSAGKTISDILPEYARRRRMREVEARELLRKVYNTWQSRNQ